MGMVTLDNLKYRIGDTLYEGKQWLSCNIEMKTLGILIYRVETWQKWTH